MNGKLEKQSNDNKQPDWYQLRRYLQAISYFSEEDQEELTKEMLDGNPIPLPSPTEGYGVLHVTVAPKK